MTRSLYVCTAQGFAKLDDAEGLGIGNIQREDLDLVLNYLGEKDLLSRKGREHLYARSPALVLFLAAGRHCFPNKRAAAATSLRELTGGMTRCATDMSGLTTPSL